MIFLIMTSAFIKRIERESMLGDNILLSTKDNALKQKELQSIQEEDYLFNIIITASSI